jgi:hypothetical protein
LCCVTSESSCFDSALFNFTLYINCFKLFSRHSLFPQPTPERHTPSHFPPNHSMHTISACSVVPPYTLLYYNSFCHIMSVTWANKLTELATVTPIHLLWNDLQLFSPNSPPCLHCPSLNTLYQASTKQHYFHHPHILVAITLVSFLSLCFSHPPKNSNPSTSDSPYISFIL